MLPEYGRDFLLCVLLCVFIQFHRMSQQDDVNSDVGY